MIKAGDGMMVISKAQARAILKALTDMRMGREDMRLVDEFMERMAGNDAASKDKEWWEVKNVCDIR